MPNDFISEDDLDTFEGSGQCIPGGRASWRLRWIWPQESRSGLHPTAFDGILELPPGLLGPRDGKVIVDLVEPDCQPISWPGVVKEMTFKDVVPWTVIRVAK
jgi:hypothetical protein